MDYLVAEADDGSGVSRKQHVSVQYNTHTRQRHRLGCTHFTGHPGVFKCPPPLGRVTCLNKVSDLASVHLRRIN